MKRLPLLLSFFALVALTASLTYWVVQWTQPPQRPQAAVVAGALPPPSIDAAATLFGGQASAAVASNYQLTGVVAAGRDSVAIIVADGAAPKALKLGKEVAAGVTVQEVHPRYVMLSDGGVLKRIDIAQDNRPAAGAPASPLPNQPQFQPQPQPQPQPMPVQPMPQQLQAPPPPAPVQMAPPMRGQVPAAGPQLQ
ncbi:MAG: type II secretion system protein N [Pseudomonadota bacterium]|nr:type II secretion system protein N [Pseudomonadota bacterium]